MASLQLDPDGRCRIRAHRSSRGDLRGDQGANPDLHARARGTRGVRRGSAVRDPAQLLLVPDHYSSGCWPTRARFRRLGVSRRTMDRPRPTREKMAHVWRTGSSTGHAVAVLAGARSVEVFGVISSQRRDGRRHLRPDRRVRGRSRLPSARPADRFNSEVISTTDPAESDLPHHAKLAAEVLGERVLPTFRPDALVYLDRPTWRTDVAELASVSGIDTASYGGFLDALRQRRADFVAAGARATDHGHLLADTAPMEDSGASELYARVLGGAEPSDAEVDTFAANMLFRWRAMSVRGGLVSADPPGCSSGPQQRDRGPARQRQGSTSRCVPSSRTRCDRAGSVRHRSPLPGDPVHRGRDRLQPGTRPLAGASPPSVGCAVVVPGFTGGHAEIPGAATETARFTNRRLRRRHQCVRVSRPATTGPAGGRGLPVRLVLEHRLSLDEAVETAVDRPTPTKDRTSGADAEERASCTDYWA